MAFCCDVLWWSISWSSIAQHSGALLRTEDLTFVSDGILDACLLSVSCSVLLSAVRPSLLDAESRLCFRMLPVILMWVNERLEWLSEKLCLTILSFCTVGRWISVSTHIVKILCLYVCFLFMCLLTCFCYVCLVDIFVCWHVCFVMVVLLTCLFCWHAYIVDVFDLLMCLCLFCWHACLLRLSCGHVCFVDLLCWPVCLLCWQCASALAMCCFLTSNPKHNDVEVSAVCIYSSEHNAGVQTVCVTEQ